MVAVSALSASAVRETAAEKGGLEDLKQTLLDSVVLRAPKEPISTKSTTKQATPTTKQPFLFFIDHCFAIKGQGTVLTGTVARGKLSIGDALELPALKQQRKVKSMQIFRRPVSSCQQGDRVGICVTQLEAHGVERGIAASPGSIPTFTGAVVHVEKVRFYPGIVKSGSKMHVIVGHQTVMAKFLFFGTPRGSGDSTGQDPKIESIESLSISTKNNTSGAFDYSKEYLYQDELYGSEGRPATAELFGGGGDGGGTGGDQLSPFEDGLVSSAHYGPQWAVVQFDEPVTAPPDSLIIGARLDADLHAAACRIALSGRIHSIFEYFNTGITSSSSQELLLHQLKVYKLKQRRGTVERVESDGCTAICRGMFSKESDLTRFIGMTVRGGPRGSTGGVLEGSFGKSGKFKVRFNEKIVGGSKLANQGVVLEYKRFIFDKDKRRIAQ